MSDPARAVEAAVRAYVLTTLTTQRRRPTPGEVATFRDYIARALGVPTSKPPGPGAGGGATSTGAANDEVTQPTRARRAPPQR